MLKSKQLLRNYLFFIQIGKQENFPNCDLNSLLASKLHAAFDKTSFGVALFLTNAIWCLCVCLYAGLCASIFLAVHGQFRELPSKYTQTPHGLIST